ncbi:hypothetical protein Ade02nite_31200 [Paractinoplanes deccanensis]|uniref:Uncharacterized protein n=1 Tax=Paractinoplanes deccanensis TaxID=113561 RepID=A0ABQ3Y3A2_9ACTN|nr:hypothetical protein [Actinoplanes deccanensis]GID74479.1 hypothetical protein Ade02nite_31200 [Actinoplanes deccanensis]
MTEPAVRLVFEYDGDEVRMLSQQRVELTIPSAGEPAAGWRAELRTAEGGVLDRRGLPWIPLDAEVFAPGVDGEPSVRRVPAERRTGVFTVLVPDLPEADHLALVDDAGGPPETRQVREILRVPLRAES